MATLAENPQNSYCWDFEDFMKHQASAGVEDTEYMACALGGRHVHDPRAWDLVYGSDGQWQ